ncbi:MAG: hypothetical protein Q8Q88_12080 [Phenylobacterium sp.]|uniref:hypothetical protein n=1 Tax=Phenylobacterium sp. TaxID=1871053 RepID=UPI002733D57C|nr:hypothetical protein [Phenylobacterium sp.]MDP3747773.1 hypothetical protein [Phenylobacterium sp.]
MSAIRLWALSSHHSAFRVGGWAHLRQSADGLAGAAGGARHITSERTALAGLAAALKDLPAGDLVVHTDSAIVLGPIRAVILGEATDPPEADLDLWVQVQTAFKGRTVSFVRAPVTPNTPQAFAAAWAELARDKAKTHGPFAHPIPRPNLAKVQGL